MVTMKEMLLVLDELKKKEHVWHSVKEYLEAYLPEGSTPAELNIDGVAIPESTVIDVLGDIDQICLEPIRERIIRIEGAKVDEEEKRQPRATTSTRPKRGHQKAEGGPKRGPGRPPRDAASKPS